MLLRLAAVGQDAIAPDVDEREREHARKLQLAALGRAGEFADAGALLADAAWL